MTLWQHAVHACRICVCVLAAALLGACATPERPDAPATAQPVISAARPATRLPRPTPPPVPAPAPLDTVSKQNIKNSIQTTLDRYARAYNDNDVKLLASTVDGTNLPFRRYVVTQFENYQASLTRGDAPLKYVVTRIEPRPYQFVQADIVAGNNNSSQWLFRKVGQEWLLSEPTVMQIGAPQRAERKHFIYITYPWSDDVNDTIIAVMERSRERAIQRLGATPSQKAVVDIRPIYGLTPYENPLYMAYYQSNGDPDGPDTIKLYTPSSYVFGFFDTELGWQETLETVLTHEYAHMIHMRCFDNAGGAATWMSEGLAEYVADSYDDGTLYSTVETGAILPIIDQSSSFPPRDLVHLASLTDNLDVGYALAHSLVNYIVETRGSLDDFWELARAYDDTNDLDAALQKAFDMSYDEFDQDWRNWLQVNYGP